MGTHPKGARASPELGDLLRRHGERYATTHRVSSIQRKVIRALSQCRTAALGGHLEACDRCGNRRAVYHSCRNRHCPKCQSLARDGADVPHLRATCQKSSYRRCGKRCLFFLRAPPMST
ncbi:MAG: transposase zinc-binding domain-containing protein [Deltaproteobacteria bacterium]|nr:transposase zinc-binding domain-containing protein [Deltaproteobacteria bacterium]